jgi:hypothetical protein
VWEPGTPGAAPKCFLASLSLGPLRRRVLVPIYNILIRIEEEKPKIFTSRCGEHKLVKSEAFSSSFNDSGSCSLGESKSSNSDLGNLKESDIISDGADDDSDSVSIAIKRTFEMMTIAKNLMSLTSFRRGA